MAKKSKVKEHIVAIQFASKKEARALRKLMEQMVVVAKMHGPEIPEENFTVVAEFLRMLTK